MDNSELHSTHQEKSPSPYIESYVARVLSVYTVEQLQEAYGNGNLSSLVYEANYDYDIDMPESALDVPATVAAVLRQIGRSNTTSSETTQLAISTEEQDEVLSRAVKEDLTHLRLTPGILKTIKERKH